MTQPTLSDAKSRALRTLAQNVGFDVLLAVCVVVLPLLHAPQIDWRLVLVSLGKTAVVTAIAGLQRAVEARRAR